MHGDVLGYTDWIPTQPKNIWDKNCAQIFNFGVHGPFSDVFKYPAAFVAGKINMKKYNLYNTYINLYTTINVKVYCKSFISCINYILFKAGWIKIV